MAQNKGLTQGSSGSLGAEEEDEGVCGKGDVSCCAIAPLARMISGRGKGQRRRVTARQNEVAPG